MPPEPYRTPSAAGSLVTVDGKELHVPDGGRLPRVCVLCGATRRLQEEAHALEWKPAGGLVFLLLGPLGRVAHDTLRRTARVTYSTCQPCVSRSRNRRDLVNGLALGVGIVLLAAATIGLNGAPFWGVGIGIVGVGGLAYVMSRLSRSLVWVTYIHGNGTVHFRGICAAAAKAAVENRRDAAGNEARDDAVDEEVEDDEDDEEDEVPPERR